MSLDTELRASTYAGNASTEAPYEILFPYLQSADIKVQVTLDGEEEATVLTESEYTVHEPVDGAPYVTTTEAQLATSTVEVFRWMDYLQPLVMPEGGRLSSEAMERALDRLTMLSMQAGVAGYSIPSAGYRDPSIWADDDARALVTAARVGQLGIQRSDGTLWRSLSTYAGDWQEVQPRIGDTGRNVRTEAQFAAAIAETGPIIIYLREDITLQTVHTAGADKVIHPGNWKFIQGSDVGGLIAFGPICADRQQIFSGFAAGEISGTFGQCEVYPEWWGLTDGFHDLAINAAVKAARLIPSNFGLKVSLAARVYDVSAPIDLASTAVTLEGAGSNLTFLRATTTWDATWVKAEQWGAGGDPANHAAMVWIGAEIGSAYSYRTKVMGMEIECYNASFAHRAGGLKRVSGISSKAGVEECTVIYDVVITNASGFGIGFCRHKASGGSFSAATVNGMHISSCWVVGPIFRDSVGIHFSQWTNNCRLETTTVDVGLAKSVSSAYADVGGGDPTIYDEPAWELDYMLAAIVAQGLLTITDVHIEGSIIGVLVLENSGANSINITNLKCFAMMDEALGAVYELDGLSGDDPASNTDNYGYGCAVMIGGQGPGGVYPNDNFKDCVTLNNISVLGSCPYIVRDSIYDVERTMYDMGQFPTGALAGRIAFYTRGNAYTGSGGGSTYNKAAPSTDRTYFIGPIY